MRKLPAVAVFFAASAGVSLALAASAYWLGAPDAAPALASGSASSCAPALARTALPNAYRVDAAPGEPALDRVEARWTLANGSVTAWRLVAAYANGADGVAFTDADGSGTITSGDIFTVNGAAGGAPDEHRGDASSLAAEFRCVDA